MPPSSTPSASDTGPTDAGLNGSHQNLLERWSRIRMGHEAVMLQDAQELLAQQRKAVTAHHQNNGLSAPSEDMGDIILGDTTINHAPPQARPVLSGLAKAGIALAAGAALGGGIGIPLAIPSIIDALKPAAAAVQPTPTPAPAGNDTDTLFDLFIGAPKTN